MLLPFRSISKICGFGASSDRKLLNYSFQVGNRCTGLFLGIELNIIVSRKYYCFKRIAIVNLWRFIRICYKLIKIWDHVGIHFPVNIDMIHQVGRHIFVWNKELEKCVTSVFIMCLLISLFDLQPKTHVKYALVLTRGPVNLWLAPTEIFLRFHGVSQTRLLYCECHLNKTPCILPV